MLEGLTDLISRCCHLPDTRPSEATHHRRTICAHNRGSDAGIMHRNNHDQRNSARPPREVKGAGHFIALTRLPVGS
jgi:hypothetical protein